MQTIGQMVSDFFQRNKASEKAILITQLWITRHLFSSHCAYPRLSCSWYTWHTLAVWNSPHFIGVARGCTPGGAGAPLGQKQKILGA